MDKTLYEIKRDKNDVYMWRNPSQKRNEETIVNRLRIGHTFLTHSYPMVRNDPPMCDSRDVENPEKHIITHAECLKTNGTITTHRAFLVD